MEEFYTKNTQLQSYSPSHSQPHSLLHSPPHSPPHSSPLCMSYPPSPKRKSICKQPLEKTESFSLWNDKLEAAAKEIGEMSLSYKLMHMEMARRSHIRYNILMYIGIIFAPLSGIISQLNSPFSSCENPYVSFVALGISFISGIVVAVIKFSRYDEIEYANKLASSKYTSLESNVRRQLALYRDNRIDASEYMEWLSNSFDELFLSSPILPHHLFSKYHELAIKNGHNPPNKYGSTININEEYEQTIIRNIFDNGNIVVNNMHSSTSSYNSVNISINDKMEVKESKGGDVESEKIDNDSFKNNTKNVKKEQSIEKEKNSVTLTEISEDISDIQKNTIKGNKIVRRTDFLVPFQELNRYSDAMMKYQLRRFQTSE